jgi:FkbM family methyltransferase
MHEIVYSILPGELVFDIGAHTGAKTEWYLNRGARVVAVEPQQACLDALQSRLGQHRNLTIVQRGVSDAAGTLIMHINEAAPVLSTFSQKWMTGRFKDQVWEHHVEVEMTTLDQLVSEFGSPRYIKIDVEGLEKQVMLGLTGKNGTISLEFTSEFFDDSRDLIWYARGLGYKRFNYSFGESDSFALPAWVDAAELVSTLRTVCAANAFAWGDIYFC